MPPPVIVRPLARRPYDETLDAMRRFTAARRAGTADEIWLVEHPPVFTLGLATRPEHLLDPGEIPVVQTERGGQVTYHGPGQLVAYLLVDLRRRGLLVRELVCRIEAAILGTLADFGVSGVRKPGAPGIYLPRDDSETGEAGAKIAALGLKVSRGCSYHGLALNVDMDLSPFERINPCGYPGLAVVDLRRAAGASRPDVDLAAVAPRLAAHLLEGLR
ncbi:MAG: lipoyl(octanoyl) transferase LipB [Burkholderiaceae bacterium]